MRRLPMANRWISIDELNAIPDAKQKDIHNRIVAHIQRGLQKTEEVIRPSYRHGLKGCSWQLQQTDWILMSLGCRAMSRETLDPPASEFRSGSAPAGVTPSNTRQQRIAVDGEMEITCATKKSIWNSYSAKDDGSLCEDVGKRAVKRKTSSNRQNPEKFQLPPMSNLVVPAVQESEIEKLNKKTKNKTCRSKWTKIIGRENFGKRWRWWNPFLG